MSKSPPKLAQRLLLRFLRNDLAEEVLGDLDEKFYVTAKERSAFRAKANYWYQVFNYLRPFAIRKSKSIYINRYDMLQNYFKIGWRNLLKNKGYSFINISGLAVGMAVAMIIGLWVFDELTFNRYHQNYPRIAQVMKGGYFEGKHYLGQKYLPYPLIDELKNSYGENFKHILPTNGKSDYVLFTDEKKISRTGIFIGE